MTTETQAPAPTILTFTESDHSAMRGTVGEFYGTPVNITRDEAIAAGLDQEARQHFLMHVTAVTAGDTSRADEYLNVAQLARVSSGTTFEYIVGGPMTVTGVERSAIGVSGTVLSPALVNGKVYSMHNSFTVQYFDEEHTQHRHSARSQFNILDFRGQPWGNERDSIMNMVSDRYIEVQPPENAITLTAPAAQEGEPTEPTTVTGAALVSRVMQEFVQYGEADEPVTIPLDEIVHHGQIIVLCNGQISTTLVDSDQDLMDRYQFTSASIDSENKATYQLSGGSRYQRPDVGSMTFYKIRRTVETARLSASEQESTIASLTARVAAADSRWDDMGEALNEMAVSHSWCSEYEDAVTPLGWPGREGHNQVADYDIEVSVNWSFEDQSTSSGFDDDIASSTDIDTDDVTSFEVDEVTMSGTAYLTIRGVEMPTDDEDLDYDEYISEDALRGMLPSGYSLDDWSYSERTER